MTFETSNISLKNDKAWRLIQNGHTIGVFQLESDLGKKWSATIKPSNINELSAVISLIRPACLESGMTETYSKVKSGLIEKPDYNDESVNSILSPTMGVLIYQEQLMKFGGEIAWRDLPYLDRLVIVDKLRKGIGKKDQKIIIDLRDKFIAGCLKNGRSKEMAEKLFSLIEGAGRYAFNDAHAKKYALWAYKTAYVKANFPLEFYCVYLTYSKGKQKPREEIEDLINEAKMLGISIEKPSVSKSNFDFSIKEGVIHYGLSHIKQVGESDAELIESIRPASFTSLLITHFASSEKIRSLALESLINCGACDEYGLSRSCMLSVYNMLKQLTQKEIEFIFSKINSESGVLDLIEAVKKCSVEQCVKKRKDIVMSEALSIDIKSSDSAVIKNSVEKDLLGIAFSYDYNVNVEDDWSCKECFNKMRVNKNMIANLTVKINDIKITKTKKGKDPGKDMCQLSIADNTGFINVVCFPDTYEKFKNSIAVGSYYSVVLKGTGFGWSVNSIKNV
jgi:DNA polymerase III alpha subunit